MRNTLKKLEIGAEELILALLILVEIFDFFTLLPASIEYGEKILSIIGICYLFYKASPTKIISGKRERNSDIMIIVAYLLLSMKMMIGFILSAAQEKSLVSGFYTLVLRNADTIEKTGFWLGGTILILTAYFLIHEKVRRPSILMMIHEEKEAKTAWRKTVRFVSTYIILLALFVVVFTFAMEWIAMTVDAAILVLVLFFYLFVIVKRGRGMKTESFLKKVSESSEGFYAKFISLLHSRKKVMTAVAGLLVLHLLVDIGGFIIPYTTGLFYSWYFGQLGAGHEPLSALMARDFALAGGAWMQIGVMLVYVLNVLAVLMLFFGPAYIWSALYNNRRLKVPRVLWLFFGSLAAFVLMPVMRIGQVQTQSLVGADITTHQIAQMGSIPLVLLITALVTGIFYILGRRNFQRTAKVAAAAVFAYFGIYLYHFFISVAKSYTSSVTLLGQAGQYFIAFHLLLFFTITIIFYLAGFATFLYEAYIKQKI
jgi:hypothetical protein